MFDIEMHDPSPEFKRCWLAAAEHLQHSVQDGLQFWLRCHLTPPFLEHLSFRIGNQLFFVHIVDVDGALRGPGNFDGLIGVADGCKGNACLMPMKKDLLSGDWAPAQPGWGLVDARTGEPVDPILLVTEEKIEMTHWELHGCAVQVVRDQLELKGYRLMSWQGDPGVNPSLWFVGDSKGPEWVVVRAARYPTKAASPPLNWDAIAARCARLSTVGHFASVPIASAEQREGELPIPLWRGYRLSADYDGLIRM